MSRLPEDPASAPASPGRPVPRPARRRRRGWIVVLVLLLIAAGIGAWRYRATADSGPSSYLTARVKTGTVEETVLANGILRPSQLTAVGAQVSGRVTSINVKVGDEVKEGDLLAQIDSVTQQNSLDTAAADLANIKAQRAQSEATLAFDQSALTRAKTTFSQQASSQSDLDSAVEAVAVTKAQIAALDAQINAAEIAVKTAQVNLGYTKITAPMSGTVLDVVTQQGQTVNATQSAPTIVILGKLDPMKVRAQISEVDVVHTKPGQKLYFTILGEPDKRYDGVLQSIDPAPESITSDSDITSSSSSSSSTTSTEAIYYDGVFTVPNADRMLRTYMTAEVHIILGQAKDVLTVPAAALGAKAADGSYTVRVLGQDGEARDRKVKIGLNDKINAQVLSGLAKGDRVVTGELAAGAAPSSGGRRRHGPMGF